MGTAGGSTKVRSKRSSKANAYQLSDEYIAGFFDGEGCVQSFKQGKMWYVRLHMGQRRPIVLEAIQKTLGYGRLTELRSGQWRLVIDGSNNVNLFCWQVLPYSIVKAGELQVARRLTNLILQGGSTRVERERLGRLIRELKHGN